MPIDTLKLARRLRDAGFNEAQAEAVADAVREGTESADLVTKSDLALRTAELRAEIAALGSELRADIAAVRSDFRAEIATLKTELLGRMFQMVLGAVLVNAIAMAGLIFAFAKLLGH
jgi:DNA-binding transcriptional MerR regulator